MFPGRPDHSSQLWISSSHQTIFILSSHLQNNLILNGMIYSVCIYSVITHLFFYSKLGSEKSLEKYAWWKPKLREVSPPPTHQVSKICNLHNLFHAWYLFLPSKCTLVIKLTHLTLADQLITLGTLFIKQCMYVYDSCFKTLFFLILFV